MKVAMHAASKMFDPHKAPNQTEYWIDQLMYSYLVAFDDQINIVPSVATSWKVSDDGLTWTYTLRTGVKFHNGRELKASDVAYSIQRILDPKIGSAIRASISDVTGVEAPNDTTVVIHLSKPNGALNVALANPRAAIVAKEIVDANGDLSQVDAGSGPFKFNTVRTDGTVVLDRFAGYWETGLPYLDRLELLPVPDTAARASAVRAGDVDMSAFITTNFISLLRKEPDMVIPDLPTSGVFYYFAMNPKVKPFDDLKVRQAIAWTLDRAALTQTSLFGEGYPLLAGPIPSWHWAAAPTVYRAPDPAKAKQLLTQSSVPNGFQFTLSIWSANDPVVRSAQLIKEELALLNIVANIQQQADFNTYWTPVTKGDYTTVVDGLSGGTDPDAWLYERFHTGGGQNFWMYSNPDVDKLLEQGRQEIDPAKRKAIYAEAQTIIANDAPVAFLYNVNQTEAWRDYVKGYIHNSTITLLNLKKTWLNK